jgi:hypothetical protein
MKKYIILCGFLFTVASVFSQYEPEQQVLTKEEQRKLEKEHKTALKKAAEEEALKVTEWMLDQRRFVLEADYIAGRSGTRYPVSSILNFVMVDSSEAVIQIGSSSGIGYNGVGGITAEGSVTRYEVEKKVGKKGTSYFVIIHVLSAMGMYDVMMSVSGSGNVDATVRGNTRGMLRYSGQLVPLKESRVYKGRSY